MTAITDHPCFVQPEDSESKIWRYMDFTKFVSMLSSNSLYFSRSDLLGDPFEGSYPTNNIKLTDSFIFDLPREGSNAVKYFISNWHEKLRFCTYINCWHLNSIESDAMWKIYSATNKAVAIQSTYKKYVSVLPNNFYVGRVNYIDYENEYTSTPRNNLYSPFVHKRKSFYFENEIRGVFRDEEVTNKIFFEVKFDFNSVKPGYQIKINLNNFIDKIFIAPTSPTWYYDLVKEIKNKFKIQKEVEYSSLDAKPIY